MAVELCHTTGKFIHETQAKAKAHLRGLQRKYNYRGGEIFRCRDCNGFHVGRQAKNLPVDRRPSYYPYP